MSTEEKEITAAETKTKTETETVKASIRSFGKGLFSSICSAVIGAAVAIGSIFGITENQVNEQKAKVTEIKGLASEALDAIKSGKFDDAKAALELATETTKEVVADAKTVIDNIKAADKEEVKAAVKTEAEKVVKDVATKAEEKLKEVKVEKK